MPTQPIRLPLTEDVEPRLADSDKDGLASNLFYDKSKSGAIYAVKRPGISSYISGSGQAAGVFGYDDTTFIFTQSNASSSYAYTHAGYGQGAFIAFGTTYPSGNDSSVGIVSTDGINWANVSIPASASPNKVKSAGNYLWYLPGSVGFSSVNYIYRSSDGTTWTQVTFPESFSWNDIAYNGSVYLVAGTGLNGRVYSSSDGITWSLQAGAPNTAYYSMAWNGTYFIARTGNGAYRTTNGVAWTLTSGPGVGGSNMVISACNTSSGVIVSVNTGTNWSYSADNGSTWSTGTFPNTATSLLYDGTKFVAQVGASVYTSTVGNSWTNAGDSNLGYLTGMYGLAYGQSKYISFPSNPLPLQVAKSTDLTTWEASNLSATVITQV